MAAFPTDQDSIRKKRRKRLRVVGLVLLLFWLAVFALRMQVVFYRVPTAGMSGTVLPGDQIVVLKSAYGNLFDGEPKRGDVAVFHYPAGDTVVESFLEQSYYQLVRDLGREKVHDPSTRIPTPNGRIPIGPVTVRALEDREPFIQRCVAIAGDTIVLIDGVLWVNGVARNLPIAAKSAYLAQAKFDWFNDAIMKRMEQSLGIRREDVMPWSDGKMRIALSAMKAEELQRGNAFFSSLERVVHPHGHSEPYARLPWFPNDSAFDWTDDNMGPLWVPRAGESIELNERSVKLYGRVIHAYEGNRIRWRNGQWTINGNPASSYTFKQDYYWMMGDNHHYSMDSRFWGFVPRDHLIGKAWAIYLSNDERDGLRGERFFKRIE